MSNCIEIQFLGLPFREEENLWLGVHPKEYLSKSHVVQLSPLVTALYYGSAPLAK